MRFEKFSDDELKHLEGSLFSNALSISYSKTKCTNRIDLLPKMFSEKSVIHLGCCDHLQLIDEKVQKGRWIHKIITDAASECIGIDINQEAIKYVKEKYSYHNVHYGNITEGDFNLLAYRDWDYLYMGEILEHINNPQMFLELIRKLHGGRIKSIAITVPNAFSFANLEQLTKNGEIINTDHRYWFTPYTLAKILLEAGYSSIEYMFIEPINLLKLSFLQKIKALLKNRGRLFKPLFINRLSATRESILMVAEFNQK